MYVEVCIMTITAVNGIYDYGATYQRQFFGSTISDKKLNDLMKEYHIRQTGDPYTDIKELYKAMYGDYSQQAQAEIARKESGAAQPQYPWESVMAKIGLAATGNLDEDRASFDSALRQLTNIAQGDQQAYLAQLKYEGQKAFAATLPQEAAPQTVSAYDIMSEVNRAFINY